MRKRVLVAEDFDQIREFLVSFIVQRGHEVIAFADGQSAINALRAQTGTFDVVITDFNMPGADGITVLRAAVETGVSSMGIQSSDIGVDDALMEGIMDVADSLASKYGEEHVLDMLPKPYKVSELKLFLDSLGLTA